MSNYRLVYFNLRGRAEPIRWMLAVADQEYVDQRLDREKEWPKVKADTRYGKVPVLWVDGQPLSQSVSICRYLGMKYGYFTGDAWLSAEGDEVADAVHDLITPAVKIIYASLGGQAEEAKKLANEFNEGFLPAVLKELESKLQDKDWYCGDKMTWVDVFAACYLTQLPPQCTSVLAPYTKVRAHMNKIVELPQIKKWIKERPQSLI